MARDVDIKFTADNIFIEGYLDDLKGIRELINAELHTITGILILKLRRVERSFSLQTFTMLC